MKLNKGWGFPGLAKKAHYFEDDNSTSLCGKWWYMGTRHDDDHDHKMNCTTCMRKRLKLLEKEDKDNASK